MCVGNGLMDRLFFGHVDGNCFGQEVRVSSLKPTLCCHRRSSFEREVCYDDASNAIPGKGQRACLANTACCK